MTTTGVVRCQRVKSFENMVKVRNFGVIPANQNCIHEEVKSRLDTGNSATIYTLIF